MTCKHIQAVTDIEPSTDQGCQDCLPIGGQWVHLRLCMDCGHVGCCDSSPNQHASAHAASEAHVVIQSFEPGEDWLYCFADEDFVESIEGLPRRSHA